MEGFRTTYSTALVVSGSGDARTEIKDCLKDVFSGFIEADDGLNAIRAFVEKRPGFIVIDAGIEDISSFSFISTIRNLSDGRDVPIMLVSERESLKGDLACPGLGASDFVVRPFSKEELGARVTTLMRTRMLMEELKEKNALLERLSITDELTGLYNRRYFYKTVKEQMTLAERHNWRAAFLTIDIDFFKRINDTYGHSTGDAVLRKAGLLLNSCKREGELLARFGGEEFVMCLVNTDPASALLAAERFRRLFKQHDFSAPNCPGLRLTVSIGIAMRPQNEAAGIEDILNAADHAMYRSKTEGRDRVSVYEWQTVGAHIQTALPAPA
ncbi:MAG: diguanylate cyclase [Deltaproteobacteria bacterium]